MGRHAIGSSPLRTPAVLVGVPVATVLATWSTTAVLGGVVPSAEEAPLRAEAPGEVVAGSPSVVPWGPPSAPAVSLDTSLLPTADPEPVSSSRTTPAVAGATTASVAHERAAAGPRVIRVVPAAAPAPTARPRVLDTDDEGGDDELTSVDVPAPRNAAEPRLAPRAVTAASPVEAVAPPSSEETDHADGAGADGSVVDLDTPSGGLSVLTFG